MCFRWPFAAALSAMLLGGPLVGGWLGRRRGDEGVVAGSVFGGVASYVGMAALAAFASIVQGPISFPDILTMMIVVPALMGVTGMLVGAVAGAVLQVALAAGRGSRRKAEAHTSGSIRHN